MKQYYFSLLLFALCISCGSEKKVQTENSISADNEFLKFSEAEEQDEEENNDERIAAWKAFANECVYMGFDSLTYHIESKKGGEEFDQKKIVLTELSKQEFETLKLSSYQLAQLLAHETDSSFTVVIKGEKWLFNKEPSTTIVDYGEGRAGLTWSEYIAYYPEYGLHALRSSAVSGDLHGFSDIFLISEESAQLYSLPTKGDSNNGTPIPSPNGEYLINIDTDYDNTIGYADYVQIIKMKEGGEDELKPFYLIESELQEYRLLDPTWIDEKSFIIRGEKQEWIDEKSVILVQYYMGEIPKDI